MNTISSRRTDKYIQIAQELSLTKKMLDAFAIEQQIKRLLQSRERLKIKQTRITSTWQQTKVKGGTGSDFAELQGDIEEREAAIRDSKNRYNALILEIDMHPDADFLSDIEFLALKHIYAYGLVIEKAAAEMHVSPATVYRCKQSAFEKLQKGGNKYE